MTDDSRRSICASHMQARFGSLREGLTELAQVDEDAAWEARMEILRWALEQPGAIFETQRAAAGYLIALEKPVRGEQAHSTLVALASIRGVVSVQPIPHDVNQALATTTARAQLEQRLWEVLRA